MSKVLSTPGQNPAGAIPSLARSQGLTRRNRKAILFRQFCLSMTMIGVLFLAALLWQVVSAGLPWLNLDFLQSFPSRFPEKAGVNSALWGSVWMIGFTILMSVPVGVGAALYLEEFARPGKLTALIQINIANLAGVPSIVYGILGLVIFVRGLKLERSVLAGAATMSLLILPVIIIAAREAIRAVPPSIRQGALALGATRWQAVRDHVLPAALPGVLTGIILALSRALGETAPLIMIGALTFVAFTPESPFDPFTTLPIQIYNWTSRPQADFHDLAAAGILVLLAVLFLMNATAVVIRSRASRRP